VKRGDPDGPWAAVSGPSEGRTASPEASGARIGIVFPWVEPTTRVPSVRPAERGRGLRQGRPPDHHAPGVDHRL